MTEAQIRANGGDLQAAANSSAPQTDEIVYPTGQFLADPSFANQLMNVPLNMPMHTGDINVNLNGSLNSHLGENLNNHLDEGLNGNIANAANVSIPIGLGLNHHSHHPFLGFSMNEEEYQNS
jgi:hypothetical protein